ncbi:hypothetical protein B9Z55_006219 [Caenorhabditis nigoni]|uniref:Uncharacterized protein n=2 Tax=Caenorhabditis nigoni TaxID=1611254 RepID=A0A2G5V475_9PELO|nr:hypothetical protein B9Z55_006219 [Caenorhabditis nigoni]
MPFKRMSWFFDRMHEEAHKIKEKIKEKSRKRKAPTAEEAIGNLKDAEELLIKKQEYFELRIEQEIEAAKKHMKTNKKMALAALRRKKNHEQELSRIDGVLTKLEAQRSALENVGMHNEVIDVLGKTNETLKKEHAKMDIDKVHDLMDEIADGLAISGEFNDAISAPIGDVADEDELLQELQELQDNVADLTPSKLPDVPTVLPEVPAAAPAGRRGKFRKMSTMEELEQWAASN